MRWLVGLLVALVLPAAASGQEITAKAAIAMEAKTGDVIFEKAADERLPIASTTKLMTALVTLEQSKLKETVTAPRYRAAPAESLFRPQLAAGEQMSVADMLRGLLMISANDAAVALAEHVSGGIRPFVAEMNTRAEQLGLENTHYANPIGLDSPENYSSAHDLATLTRELRKSKFFRATVNTVNTTLETGNPRPSLTNRNVLLQRDGNEWVTGVKTGQTSLAGNVLVASGFRKGVSVISVVIGADGAETAADEAEALMEFAFTRFVVRPLAVRGGNVTLPVKYRPGATLPVRPARSPQRVMRRDATVRGVNELPDEVEGPIAIGDRVGVRKLFIDDEQVARVPLIATVEIPGAGVGRETQDFLTRPSTLAIFGVVLLVAAGLMNRRRATPREETPA